MKTALSLLFSLSFFMVFPQRNTLKFESILFDYGSVSEWNNPPASFIFTNAGDESVLFLPTFQRDDFFAEIPKNKILPGQSDTIFVYYFTSSTGEFQKSIEIFIGNSDVPAKLTVKGNILSLDPQAFTSCPGFAPKTERVDDLALVIDSLSGFPKPEETRMDEMVFETPDEKIIHQAITDTGILPFNQYAPNNIVFLIDVSSSMKKPNKLPRLKTSMKNLTEVLRNVDYIAVITYSTASQVMLTPTVADNKSKIISLIDTLTTSGTTNGVKGLKTAYDIAEQNFIAGGNNQIIIATDGLFNNPDFSESDLYSMVKLKAKERIKLSVIGFGQDEGALKMMKRLAEKGSGSFIQIPDAAAANEILIREIKLQSAINKQ